MERSRLLVTDCPTAHSAPSIRVGHLSLRQKNHYATTERTSVVRGKNLRLGLGLAVALAGMGGSYLIFYRHDRRWTVREDKPRLLYYLYPRSWNFPHRSLLLERRKSKMALGIS